VKLAVMQPYLFPYIGYFQLLAAVDEFVVYDNIEYTKKGWINRNRLLDQGRDVTFTVPIASASDYLDVRERHVAESYEPKKLINRFAAAYRKAPHVDRTMPLVEDVLAFGDRNLFGFLHHSLQRTMLHLGIDTALRVSSTVSIDHGLRGQEKVLAFCKALAAETYINPIGGLDLYSRSDFANHDIALQFLKTTAPEYPQQGQPFVPALSIIDVLMHVDLDEVRSWLETRYELV
jgi:hypothetical protein